MSVFCRPLALLLLALWLPATMHCDLAAAGIEFFPHGDHHSAACPNDCADGSCSAVEGASYVKPVSDQRVLPPVASLYFCLLSLLAPPVVVGPAAVCLSGDPPEIQALHRTWQFARRAALPARAPDRVA